MLKQISIEELRVDMYVHEFVQEEGVRLPKKKSGRIKDPIIIAKLQEFGVRNLIIDVTKGADTVHSEPVNDPLPTGEEAIENALTYFAEETSVEYRALGFEWFTAKEVFTVSNGIVADTFAQIRDRGTMNLSQFERAAKAIDKSLKRNKDALIWFGKLRQPDRYVFEHAVNCAVLMGVFCQSRNMEQSQVEQAIAGALLQNIGEAKLPTDLVSKSGKLSDEELAAMQSHVALGAQLLEPVVQLSPIIRNIVSQHHERVDGTGYPQGLRGDQIDEFARMAAIVDSYDALATKKVYREAIPPSQAMKIVLEDSKTRYDESLVHQFIRCMGVYPTGSLVKLSNDLLAVVMEQNQEQRLAPDVKVIYNLRSGGYMSPFLLKLSSGMVEEKIVGYEDPRKHGIDVTDFMPNDDDFR